MSKMKTSWQACACAALAALSATTLADDIEWVYDTSKRVESAPASAEVMVAGLDAKARGLGESTIDTLDKWYWSWMDSNDYDVSFGRIGFLLMFR